ncbi:hypothetical protein ACA910_010813 [Epithemia clementina (nom. ined.)]
MEQFYQDHSSQLEALHIPPILFPGLLEQLESTFSPDNDDFANETSSYNAEDKVTIATKFFPQSPTTSLKWTVAGTLIVIPHVCEWDIQQENGLWQALSSQQLSLPTLRLVYHGLVEAQSQQPFHPSKCNYEEIENEHDLAPAADQDDERIRLQNAICAHPQTWARIFLYRSNSGTVRAALPAPPYYPASNLASSDADLTGPFPFMYNRRDPISGNVRVIPTFLAHWGERPEAGNTLPTVDLVPPHTCPNDLVRAVRYVALFGAEVAPRECLLLLQKAQSQFVHEMHTIRQQKLENKKDEERNGNAIPRMSDPRSDQKIWKVYTDTNDPLGLAHPESGLDISVYHMVENASEADIIFSFQSLFSPKCQIYNHVNNSGQQMINQYPYEGAWVQKDHLARGILEQHGLPLPDWALESFDLDVHLAQFVATTLAMPGPSLWIVKPAHGTQSRGHVVTRSLAHILKLLDAGKPPSRVAQRYIENPVTYQGRKVDCRCLVVIYSHDPLVMFLHKRVYFRIADQRHSVENPQDWNNPHVVLTASHLLPNDRLADEERAENFRNDDGVGKLPVDFKTIAHLEEEYPGEFDWQNVVWPKIQTLVRDLFGGMSNAYADRLRNTTSCRAVYGVDIMFERLESERGSVGTEPKLTEVTFCPANNAICDAYERDDQLYKSYNTELFDCMFRGRLSENWLAL